ncbi:MAG: MoaD/ThiS family protein [Deltaproteobacteria bacterium]|nr:MoaD/ThiS family protein [Deltaproteobacteria bacterium]
MSVQVNIHKTHRQHTNGLEVVETRGRTVGECLKDLVRQYPTMGNFVFAKGGKLSPLLEIYVNAESAYPDELAKPVKDGDAIHITLMLSGG